MKQTTIIRPAPKRTMSPVFWLLFGAGGMLSALFGPALIVLTGFMLPRGIGVPARFADYNNVLTFVQNPFAKLVLLAVIVLFFWHGAERIYLTLKDMRAGPLAVLRLLTYGVAAVLTLVTAVVLVGIGF